MLVLYTVKRQVVSLAFGIFWEASLPECNLLPRLDTEGEEADREEMHAEVALPGVLSQCHCTSCHVKTILLLPHMSSVCHMITCELITMTVTMQQSAMLELNDENAVTYSNLLDLNSVAVCDYIATIPAR